MRQGEMLRQQLKDVAKTRHQGKVMESQQLLADIPAGRPLKERAIRLRAKEVADVLFSVGGLDATRKVLVELLDRSEVSELLGDGTSRTSISAKNDEEAKAHIVEAAHDFLHGVLESKGRRNLVSTDAFWAILCALVPEDVFEKRLGRSVMRLLGVQHTVVRKAHNMRAELQESAKGWKRVTTLRHMDALDLAPVTEWLHTQGTTEDNSNKVEHRVYVDVGESDEVQYDIHYQRYFNHPIGELREQFLKSDVYTTMNLEHKERVRSNANRAKRIRKQLRSSRSKQNLPNLDEEDENAAVKQQVESVCDLQIGLKTFRRAICPCMRARHESKCECEKCSFVSYNLKRLHKERTSWYQNELLRLKQQYPTDSEVELFGLRGCGCCLNLCKEGIRGCCLDPNSPYRRATSSPTALESFLLCEQVHIPALDISSSDQVLSEFHSFRR